MDQPTNMLQIWAGCSLEGIFRVYHITTTVDYLPASIMSGKRNSMAKVSATKVTRNAIGIRNFMPMCQLIPNILFAVV